MIVESDMFTKMHLIKHCCITHFDKKMCIGNTAIHYMFNVLRTL